jgi:hypothetical protein
LVPLALTAVSGFAFCIAPFPLKPDLQNKLGARMWLKRVNLLHSSIAMAIIDRKTPYYQMLIADDTGQARQKYDLGQPSQRATIRRNL